MVKKYGVELILDLHKCDATTFTKEKLSEYFVCICKEIKMVRYGEPMFWVDNSDTPRLRGVSGIQFITTSNIVVHTLDILETVYVNIFSCKEFDIKHVEVFTKNYFGAKDVQGKVIERA